MTTILSGTKITGGFTLRTQLNFFVTQPSNWSGYLLDSGAMLDGNTLTTDGSTSGDFIYQGNADIQSLIQILGDPGSNGAHGGSFMVDWSAGSTTTPTLAFVALFSGNDGPIPVPPGQYAIYMLIYDLSSSNPIAGNFIFPAKFTLSQQLF